MLTLKIIHLSGYVLRIDFLGSLNNDNTTSKNATKILKYLNQSVVQEQVEKIKNDSYIDLLTNSY